MANRVLAGNRSTGGFGFYVSRPTSNVLTCTSDELMFNTNSGESGASFFSAGHFQVVPVSGGTGASAPVAKSETIVPANGTASPSYLGIASTQIMLWGSSDSIAATANSGTSTRVYNYSSLGSTSATINNVGSVQRTVRNATFNLLSVAALF